MISNLRAPIAILSGAIAVLAGVAAAFGVFARGDGTYVSVVSARGETYEMATTGVYAYNAMRVVAEGVGWDVFTLLVAAPTLLLAAVLLARGSFSATLVTGGMLGYFVYMYLEYTVTWAFGPLFPLFVVILAASLIALIGVGALVQQMGLQDRFGDAFPRRTWAVVGVGMAVMLTAMWSARIAGALTANVPALEGETTMTVQALDLGVMVPVTFVLVALALRRRPVGLAASAAFVITYVAMSAAIGSMLISAWITSGVLDAVPIAVFGVAAVAGLVTAIRMHRSIRPLQGRAMSPMRGARPADLPAAG